MICSPTDGKDGNDMMNLAMNTLNNTVAAKGFSVQFLIQNRIRRIKDGVKEFYNSYINYEEKEDALGLTPEMKSRMYL